MVALKISYSLLSRRPFTATPNPAGQPLDVVPGDFVGTARVLFRSARGAPAPSEPFTAAPNVWQLLS